MELVEGKKVYFSQEPISVVHCPERLFEDLFTFVYFDELESYLEQTGSGRIKEDRLYYAEKAAVAMKAIMADSMSPEMMCGKEFAKNLARIARFVL